MSDNSSHQAKLTRRRFLKVGSFAGAGLVLRAPSILRAESLKAPSDELCIGFIGCGKQHEVLFDAMANLSGLPYVAACDIMRDRVGGTFARIRSIFGDSIARYTDAEEMLSEEKRDAVFVASSHFWHAFHTIMALEAGCHVYCEKMMAESIESARQMVLAAKSTGKLCQIGHQRRSNPRYRFVLNELVRGIGICGRIINPNAQWNRSVSASQDIVAKASLLPDKETLLHYGFWRGKSGLLTSEELQHRFLNWRWYRQLSGGPISDLGAHQIDIFNWFFGCPPKAVMASGGRNYFRQREHFDNVMCVFEYDTPEGGARSFYQLLTTTSAGGECYEAFFGVDGTIQISEREAFTSIYKESAADVSKWNERVRRGLLKKESVVGNSDRSDGIAAYESAPLRSSLCQAVCPSLRINHTFVISLRQSVDAEPSAAMLGRLLS